MLAQTEMIKDSLSFLSTDAINRLIGLAAQNTQTHEGIGTLSNLTTEAISRLNGLAAQSSETQNAIGTNHGQVLTRLQELMEALPDPTMLPENLATSNDVEHAREALQDILLILFGLVDCPPEAGGLCPDGRLALFATPESVQMVQDDVEELLSKIMDIQDALDGAAGMPEVEVQVAEVTHDASGTSRRYILTTTVDGGLVDAILVKGTAVIANKTDPAMTEDVTGFAAATSLGPGMLDVTLALPHELKKATVVQLEVFFDDGDIMAHGIAQVHSVGKGDD